MMNQHSKRKRFAIGYLLLILILLIGWESVWVVSADGEEGPDRTITKTIEVLEHTWWVVQWSDNEILCELNADHEGLPTGSEIYYRCEEASTGGDTSKCSGLYLYYISSQPEEREIQEELPAPEVWISLRDCRQFLYGYRCFGAPVMQLMAEEPLPFEHITAIHAEVGGEEYSCETDICIVPLTEEYPEGTTIEFWAESSFGEESETFTALVRTILIEQIEKPSESSWQVDVLSTQWQDDPPQACSLTWGAFLPVEGLPGWLQTPEDPADLASDEPYELLAGRLICWGFVEAKGCPFDGLLANGMVSNCGVEATRAFVDDWQDRFDARILEVVQNVDAPANLIKNVFAQESQFWPGEFPNVSEYGLGQLNAEGGDALLLLNNPFYQEFCPLVLSEETCEDPYHELDEDLQELLRGALTIQANVTCPECPGGIDLTQAELSVDLFGQILRANCVQVGGG
ncbi:MAG: hypothetical protein A2Z14_03275 [Chloroflexi bacterium RBG_16_48_8]|nr:MAG: hypothetical protein A2Z14_03275 [Chloroflexi bacterium RBG_16_48_8]